MRARRYRKKTWREKVAFKNWWTPMIPRLMFYISPLTFCAGLLIGTLVMAGIDRWII